MSDTLLLHKDFIQELKMQGDALEVLEPEWLRKTLLESALKVVNIYQKPK